MVVDEVFSKRRWRRRKGRKQTAGVHADVFGIVLIKDYARRGRRERLSEYSRCRYGISEEESDSVIENPTIISVGRHLNDHLGKDHVFEVDVSGCKRQV